MQIKLHGRIFLLVMLIALIAASCVAATSDNYYVAPVNADGVNLTKFINALNVEDHWAKGQYVNWETGATIDGSAKHWATDKATHCSGYASAICALLNVPLLHPPFPPHGLYAAAYGVMFSDITAKSDSLLASKQSQWLLANANSGVPDAPFTVPNIRNWCRATAYQAQSYANQGFLAVVVYENSDSSKPGHIAVIVPYQPERMLGDYPGKSSDYTSLTLDGPYEAQSGGFNSSYTTVSRGFAPPKALSKQWFYAGSSKNQVRFYVYYMSIDWKSVSLPSAVK